MRDMLFLSHASPEDNEFTRWLALQLAKEGYPAWCDLTKLLGGEAFWQDIEEVIRNRAMKFLFVLSKSSNQKRGPLQELEVANHVARQTDLRDFVIPLLIDDLPLAEMTIQLAGINVVPFNHSWAVGLKILLDKLERDAVAKNPKFAPTTVASWWREQFSADKGVLEQPEEYLSNWFPIEALPDHLYFHMLRKTPIGEIKVADRLPFPAFQHQQYLVSFAAADDFIDRLGPGMSIAGSESFDTEDFLDRKIDKRFIDPGKTRDALHRLLSMAWDHMISRRSLMTYQLANGANCFYFTTGLAPKDRVTFLGVNGRSTYRQVVGYKTISTSKGDPQARRYWHFGVQAKPIVYPDLAFIIKPHVLFSSDGVHLWDSKPRLHAARRSQCKDWWNADWRDRILATMHWLANADGQIELLLGTTSQALVSSRPLNFDSPDSYLDPEPSPSTDEVDVIEFDEVDDLEDDSVDSNGEE
jgi:hypothetical protein